jgi:hypothetical protein
MQFPVVPKRLKINIFRSQIRTVRPHKRVEFFINNKSSEFRFVLQTFKRRAMQCIAQVRNSLTPVIEGYLDPVPINIFSINNMHQHRLLQRIYRVWSLVTFTKPPILKQLVPMQLVPFEKHVSKLSLESCLPQPRRE